MECGRQLVQQVGGGVIGGLPLPGSDRVPSAFLLAGAESAKTPLWDSTTEEHRNLIVKFYRMLKAGADTETALRKIKSEMLEQGRHPFY